MNGGAIVLCLVIIFFAWLQKFMNKERWQVVSKSKRHCGPGFTLVKNKCIDINECQKSRICGTLHCSNTVGTYICDCTKGFIKEGASCSDIDECFQKSVCLENSVCRNTEGSYGCECNAGFRGDYCMIDINECESGTVSCDPNAECFNTYGSYRCSCVDGYFGNGKSCFEGNCPDSNCPRNQKCKSATTLACECKKGFRMDNSTACTDINECSTSQKCDQAECINTVGSYICREIQVSAAITEKSATTTILATTTPATLASSTSSKVKNLTDFSTFSL